MHKRLIWRSTKELLASSLCKPTDVLIELVRRNDATLSFLSKDGAQLV